MEKNEPVIIRQCENGFIITDAPGSNMGIGVVQGSEFVFNQIEQVNQFLVEHFSKPSTDKLARPD